VDFVTYLNQIKHIVVDNSAFTLFLRKSILLD